MKDTANAWLDISLDAVEYNVKQLVKYTKPATVMAIIKADACGHGALTLAPIIVKAGAKSLGVARISEAMALRRSGINVPIHVFGPFDAAAVNDIITGNFIVDPKLGTTASKLSAVAQAKNKQITVHVEVDFGLHRWGVSPKDLPSYLESIKKEPGLNIEGIFTHFPNLDQGNYIETERIFEEFLGVAAKAEIITGKRLVKHVCNTVGAMALPHMHLDMVRPGVGLYGLLALPLDTPISLRPALSLKSKVGLIREIEAGVSVGYGSIHRAEQKTRIAVIPLGFGDGLPPQVGANGEAIVKGVRVPVIGKASTDAVVLDVGGCKNIRTGDEVIFIGKNKNESLRAENLARQLNIFVDPILINLGRGLRRNYYYHGRRVTETR